MALVTVQRSPSPSNSAASEDVVSEDTDEVDVAGKPASPPRQRSKVSLVVETESFSESYFTVKGAALILPQSEQESLYASKRITKTCDNEIHSHLQSMFYLLRPQDTIKIAVRLETTNSTGIPRYMAVVSCIGRQDTEESVILGIDCQESATIGLVYPIYADTSFKLDGDGGFVVSSDGKLHVFKPVSVQAMWSALQSLNKIIKMARDNRYIPSGLSHTWTGYYDSTSLRSTRVQISEWYTNEDVEFFKSMPVFVETDDEESQFKKRLNVELKNVMMRMDLEEATCKAIRTELQAAMNMDLSEHKSYIDQEMMRILGQMDSPTLIKDYLYLGSEWNASNMEELTNNGVGHILNVSREIDNFFPGCFVYQNIREWDSEETDLMKHWDRTFLFIREARNRGSKVLVHCKMGISRSASTVMAYLMKEYRMTRQEAYDFVKEKRGCIMPNSAFWKQLETYEGILQAKGKLELFKSKSQQDLLDAPAMDEVNFNSRNYQMLTDKDMTRCQSLPGDLDNSVFLHDMDLNSFNLEPNMEGESRSADSAEDSLSDHPSPKPEEEKSLICFIGGEDDDDDDGHQSEGMEEVDWNKPQSTPLPAFKIIKPDGSWIKEEVPNGVGKESVKVEVVMEEEKEENEEIQEVEPKVDEGSLEIHSPFVHLRENIPWNPGTVKKTKENIEGKKTDFVVGGEMPDQIIRIVGAENAGIREDLKLDLAGVTMSESTDFGKDSCTPTSDSSKNSGSVYDKEEIPLAPGTVKRTLKEIEEKHGVLRSKDLPSLQLKRSASLKSPRENIRRRHIDRERRKTCNPVLIRSPRSPEEEAEFEWRRHSTGETFSSSKSGSEEAATTAETKQAVYRLMGEEIKLEEGIVRRQKEGIEGKNRQSSPSNEAKDPAKVNPTTACVQGSSAMKKEDVNLGTDNLKNVPNKTDCALDTNMSANNNALESTKEDVPKQSVNQMKSNFEKSPTPEESCKKESSPKSEVSMEVQFPNPQSPDPLLCSFAEKKLTFEKISSVSSTPTPMDSPEIAKRLKRKSQSEARFDSETLELIREIGSALMNSPAKCEIEPDADLDSSGNFSLVRHFVRDIETRTKKERKPARQIIIIDKESQAKKKRNWRFSAPVPGSENADEEIKRPLAKSVSQPISVLEEGDNGMGRSERGEAEKSSESKPAESSVSPGTSSTDCSVAGDHIDRVCNLVGKFRLIETKRKSPPNVKCDSLVKSDPPSNIELEAEAAECKSDATKEEETMCTAQTEEEENSNSESESLSPDNIQLRLLKENLRKTNIYSPNRPQSAELRRSNTSPGCALETVREKLTSRLQQRNSSGDLDPEMDEGKRKIRKLQGRSHPLTKLENRRSNPFYSTM